MLDFLFGEGQYGIRFLFAFIVVLGLIGLTAWLVRRFGATHLGAAAARGRQPRLAVIDAAAVDGRRRLVLIRRDNVEHLLMIGGPTDVVIEPNIVRAAGRDLAPIRQPAAVSDTLPRPAPLAENGSWPMQPEPALAPQAAPRRAASQPIEEPLAEWPEEPEPQQPPRQGRPVDPLAGLAAELSRHPPPEPPASAAPPRPARPREVAREVPREPAREPVRDVAREPMREVREPMREAAREPIREGREPMREVAREPARAPQPQPAPEAPFPSSADQNLAEMAQRLEAALRRPGARAEARAEVRPEPRPRPVAEPVPQDEPPPDEPPASEQKREAKPAPQRSLYDSLEQEMASLLGRPNSKA